MKAAWTTAEATSDTDMQLLRLKLGKENALAKCRKAAWPAKSLLVLLRNKAGYFHIGCSSQIGLSCTY